MTREAFHLVSGSVPLDKAPDGNSVFLEAPQGLIVIDTGRHPEHSARLIDYARDRERPIAAIVNSHWHLDHTTGNLDIREAFPAVETYATTAIEGALVGILDRHRAQTDAVLADPSTPSERKAQLLRGRHRIDHPDTLRPTRPVLRSGPISIAGRTLDVRVAPFAATEADLWIYDREAKLAIVGDLVVDLVPFMDTACPDGWSKALDEIEYAPFETLIPGHGPVMSRADFLTWKTAFNNLVACGRSNVDTGQCVAGWEHDAAMFIPDSHRDYVREAADDYITTRLRSSEEEQQRFCKPLEAA
ncbi:MAG TPA: MBL fold metallo-hydrolase [Candidatus Limnocylindrales bacterium]|jgi:glyoxylase-like metal-dependent hydrolase (beta-lactamase superfamily II)